MLGGIMWGNNIYSNPEKYGLEVVGIIEWREPCWDFDFSVVWKSRRGEYWIGSDSGCSCPVPFEDVGLSDLDGPYNKKALRSKLDYMVKQRAGEYSFSYGEAHLRKQAREILDRIK
jgi:hypothetical protein